MRVLIDQQFHLGHHYQYLSCLLPALSGVADELVVAITAEGMASVEFKSFLAGVAPKARFEAVLPSACPWVPMKERLRVHMDLREIVRKFEPDYVLIPSGDAQTTAMAGFRAIGLGSLPGRPGCEVGIHFGSGRAAGPTARCRDFLNMLNLKAADVRRVHIVNLMFFDAIRASSPADRRFTLMPHPVTRNPRLTKLQSRRLLNLPEEGRYVGLAASIDSRKAIPEFLAAFRAVSTPGERLLLAGSINGTHLATLSRSFGDLIEAGRVIVLSGFLPQTHFQAVLTALDLVCVPYPGFMGLSSTLLEGVAAGRPLLANAAGWCQEMVSRFNLGWTCNVKDIGQFSSVLREALDRCEQYVESEAVSRLLDFHAPENFAETWVVGIKEKLGRAAAPIRSWDWVMEAASSQANACSR